MPRAALASAGATTIWRIPRTVEAWLTTDLEALQQSPGGLLPQEQEAQLELHDRVQREHAPPLLSGLQLYAQLERCRVLQTGCAAIDGQLLHGGLRGGQLLEVCGESASGKTQLCLAAAVMAARAGLRVVFLDSSNALRGSRLQQLAHAAAQAGAPPQAADPLKYVEVRRCYALHALLAALDELLGQVAQQAQRAQQAQQGEEGVQPRGEGQEGQQQGGQQQDTQHQQGQQGQQQQQGQQGQQGQEAGSAPAPPPPARRGLSDLPVGLLVVDSLSALVGPLLGGGQHSQGHALLATAAAALKAFAAASGAAVLVTNHLVGGSDERRHEKRAAMGESWRNQPHTRIQLGRPPLGSEAAAPHTATLRASSLLPAGLSVAFHISGAGLEPGPPPGPDPEGGLQAMQQ